jgi:hypothetical protein
MNRNVFTSIALGFLALAMLLQFLWTSSVKNDTGRVAADLIQTKDSLVILHLVVDSLRAQTPGLGDYMTTMQLHTAKLWFAGQASNWKLAKYEIDELAETMEAAESLHARRKDVDVSSVLRSIRFTLVPLLDQALVKKSPPAFGDAYNQALVACNGCHRPAGYEFIQIITPTREPVSNQQWSARGR